jgi:hypothetical protein
MPARSAKTDLCHAVAYWQLQPTADVAIAEVIGADWYDW